MPSMPCFHDPAVWAGIPSGQLLTLLKRSLPAAGDDEWRRLCPLDDSSAGGGSSDFAKNLCGCFNPTGGRNQLNLRARRPHVFRLCLRPNRHHISAIRNSENASR
jgi:hypothetical protein